MNQWAEGIVRKVDVESMWTVVVVMVVKMMATVEVVVVKMVILDGWMEGSGVS